VAEAGGGLLSNRVTIGILNHDELVHPPPPFNVGISKVENCFLRF
jgi:hypothetical protein